MQYRTLGKTGLPVSEVGYGTWGIGGKQWQGGADTESIAALHRAIELGLNFIDTALAYGDGHSEQLVGRVVREAKKTVYVASKVPPKNRKWPALRGTDLMDVFPPGYIIESTDESLRNLGLDHIDLQQLHVWNPEWLTRDEWRRDLETIKTSGKVRFVGISINDHDPDSALDLVKTGLMDVVQVIYNIFDQSAERALFPLCQQHNVGVIARVPFDEGSLSGAVTADTVFAPDDFRAFYFRGDRRAETADHVAALKKDLRDRPLPETALAFCLSHPAVSTVIPGMRQLRHVESNLGSDPRLPADVLAILRRHAWGKNYYC
jgi:aryl-alcohol dehydrogenase-like predicted oxidoreductase